jgi:hypothetical protein
MIIMFGSFLPSLFVGSHHQSLLGPGSRHCYGINYIQNSSMSAIAGYKQLSVSWKRRVFEEMRLPGLVAGQEESGSRILQF